jgi:alkylation response protein AidB-like acyl-CoA dehydrogenase
MFYSKRDLQFHLNEVLQVESLCQYPYFQDHSTETFQLVLESAEQIATQKLLPLLTVMDRQEPQLVNGKIMVHEGMKEIVKLFGTNGWINAPFNYDEDGQQLPLTLHNAAGFIFQAANYSASVFPFLSTGAANLIRNFASKELNDTFCPKLYSGEWQGTMALTEPDAGSSLSDLSTSAEPTAQEGIYAIKGQKIYISCGDHDACQNVVHLMLARIKGAPEGVKGISLFIVPQKRLSGGGLVSNDVETAGVYHKMGYKGAPIAHLMVGSNNNTEGYLVGEPNKGLTYMFQMMNEARVGVGMNATAIGTAAFYASLAYAKERPQGRRISEKDPTKPQQKIIVHADVKRLLLFQKAVVEGSLDLLLFCSKLADLMHVTDGEEKENAAMLLDFLTPLAKSYPSEMCCQTTSAAVQILGGAGYTTDFPVEQFYREARIHPIHEGTTAIHGLDLLGRKFTINKGQAGVLFFLEVGKTIQKTQNTPSLKPLGEQLANELRTLQKVTTQLLGTAKEDVEKGFADATLFLEAVGHIAIAWRWLEQAHVAEQNVPEAHEADKHFYQGKVHTAKYFFEYELPKVKALFARLSSEADITVAMQEAWF